MHFTALERLGEALKHFKKMVWHFLLFFLIIHLHFIYLKKYYKLIFQKFKTQLISKIRKHFLFWYPLCIYFILFQFHVPFEYQTNTNSLTTYSSNALWFMKTIEINNSKATNMISRISHHDFVVFWNCAKSKNHLGDLSSKCRTWSWCSLLFFYSKSVCQ